MYTNRIQKLANSAFLDPNSGSGEGCHLLSGPDPSLPLLSGVAEVAEMVAGGHKPPQQEDTKLDQHLLKNEVTELQAKVTLCKIRFLGSRPKS